MHMPICSYTLVMLRLDEVNKQYIYAPVIPNRTHFFVFSQRLFEPGLKNVDA